MVRAYSTAQPLSSELCEMVGRCATGEMGEEERDAICREILKSPAAVAFLAREIEARRTPKKNRSAG